MFSTVTLEWKYFVPIRAKEIPKWVLYKVDELLRRSRREAADAGQTLDTASCLVSVFAPGSSTPTANDSCKQAPVKASVLHSVLPSCRERGVQLHQPRKHKK